jgi:hypothetical protein
MIEDTREELIVQIKHLISVTGEEIEINPKFLEYFEFEELKQIRDDLEFKKDHQDDITNEYLDDLYMRHSS